MMFWLTRLTMLHIASQARCPRARYKEISLSILHQPSHLSQCPNTNVSTAYAVRTTTAAATKRRNRFIGMIWRSSSGSPQVNLISPSLGESQMQSARSSDKCIPSLISRTASARSSRSVSRAG